MITKIIICDDDEFTLQLIKFDLEMVITNYQLPFQIAATIRNFNELQHFLHHHQENYLYFMDFDFGTNQLNGIDIAHFIRQVNSEAKIIFVTSHTEVAMSILKSGTEPLGFIEKTLDRKMMLDKYRYYLEMVKPASLKDSVQDERSLSIPIGVDEFVQVVLDQILYIDTDLDLPHHIRFHTSDNSKLTVRWTLKNVLKKLPANFIRIHRSTVVNSKAIVGVDHGQLRLTNGEMVPCSRKQQKQIQKLLKMR